MSPSLVAGLELFNEQKFWEAHEAWEELWLKETGDEKQFLQGLIQLAAAYHHVQRGTFPGAVRLFEASLRRLAPFEANHDGIDRESAVRAAERHRSCVQRAETIDASEYPKLRLVNP